MPINHAGFFDLPEAEYHADPCAEPSLSSGVVSTIVGGTLAEARWKHPRLNPLFEEKDSTKFDLGSVAHMLLLGKGRKLVVIDADDWRTKAAKEQRDEAVTSGFQPVLLSVYEQAEAMVSVARDQLADNSDNLDAFAEGKGIAEQVGIAPLPSPFGEVMCRTRMDWRHTGRPIIWDYKTKRDGADPDLFVRYLFNEARDVQDPFYSLVLARLLEIDPREVEFRFVVQSATAPYPLAVIQLDDQAREFAFERVRFALGKWAQARAENRWPGFRPRTHFVAAPPYALTRWGEKIMAEEMAEQLDERAAALADNQEGN